MGVAKKRRLTPKLINQFVKLIRDGLPFDACCDMLEVSTERFWTWRNEGENFLNSGGGPPEHEDSARFVAAIRKAFAEYKYGHVKRANTKADWIRSLALLERRDRRNFGRREVEGGSAEEYSPDDKFL
tara:strand:- start:6834 stop:7217 length:384 start_codon:yes stop_codon:yes gene_type:complete